VCKCLRLAVLPLMIQTHLGSLLTESLFGTDLLCLYPTHKTTTASEEYLTDTQTQTYVSTLTSEHHLLIAPEQIITNSWPADKRRLNRKKTIHPYTFTMQDRTLVDDKVLTSLFSSSFCFRCSSSSFLIFLISSTIRCSSSSRFFDSTCKIERN